MNTIFKAGGALTNEQADIYIERQADRVTLTHLRVMDYLLVIKPRQQGKTSLINHLMCHPALGDMTFAYVDVTTPDRSTEATWYQTLCPRILRQLRSFVPRDQWPASPQNSAGWREFLCDVATLATDAHRRVGIALDEIGAVTFPGATEFFSVLRDVYNSRQAEPELKQLTFLLSGAFHPRDLIKDDKISPFNIAQRVRLADFSLAQVQELVSKGEWPDDQVTVLAKRIHHWTDGQPYLTQLLCSYLGSDATPADVDAGVERLRREDENHLPPMLERLNGDEKLCKYVNRVLDGERIKFYPRENRRQAQLELLGIIKADVEGYCIVRNRICGATLRSSESVVTSSIPDSRQAAAEDFSKLRQLRLDAAVPDRVHINKAFVLTVAVRQPTSPILKESDLPRVGSGELKVKWRKSEYFIKLRMQVSAPECEIDGPASRSFDLYSGQDSQSFHFHLTPKNLGDISIIVAVYQHDDWLGSARVDTTAYEHFVGGVQMKITSYSLPQAIDLPPELWEQLLKRSVALFLGADWTNENTGLPSRADLARELARRKDLDESLSLAEVAQRVGQADNRWEFTAFIRDALDTTGKSPQSFHQRIVALVKEHQIETIITTAYDNLLELAFQEVGVGINRVVRGSDVNFIKPDRPCLIKLYGDAQQPDSLVVTDRDHSELLRDRDREPLIDEVRRAFRRNMVLFLGYNLSDPDFRFLFDQVAESRFARTAYAVWPGLPESDLRMWRDRGIVILDTDPFGILTGVEMPSASPLRPEPVIETPVSSSIGGNDMNYERGLDALGAQLEQTNRYLEFTTLEARLRENLRDERIFGTTETVRADRARIVLSLNELALQALGLSFNDLALGQVPATGQVSAQDFSLVQKLGVVPTPGGIKPPVQPRLQDLPFSELSWEQFEAICAALVEAQPSTITCNLYGVQGDDQQGIDIVAEQRGAVGDETWAYQCKRYQEYTPGKLKEALDKMTYDADYYVLMLSIPARAALRQITDERPNTFLWDAKDIARKLKNYPAIVEDFFGAAWRGAFCG